ncbi:hypothetical protein Dda_8536 [Drechslerella dactyloides]|uniref:Uncharacterized protein n=1 Tax=Drechslerella dactyloides TaxID=74499 RepID=A0AAD6IQT4_DREDA|nr:hypothetical protein Dda_8536 [Drechslerella dactyloides]
MSTTENSGSERSGSSLDSITSWVSVNRDHDEETEDQSMFGTVVEQPEPPESKYEPGNYLEPPPAPRIRFRTPPHITRTPKVPPLDDYKSSSTPRKLLNGSPMPLPETPDLPAVSPPQIGSPLEIGEPLLHDSQFLKSWPSDSSPEDDASLQSGPSLQSELSSADYFQTTAIPVPQQPYPAEAYIDSNPPLYTYETGIKRIDTLLEANLEGLQRNKRCLARNQQVLEEFQRFLSVELCGPRIQDRPHPKDKWSNLRHYANRQHTATALRSTALAIRENEVAIDKCAKILRDGLSASTIPRQPPQPMAPPQPTIPPQPMMPPQPIVLPQSMVFEQPTSSQRTDEWAPRPNEWTPRADEWTPTSPAEVPKSTCDASTSPIMHFTQPINENSTFPIMHSPRLSNLMQSGVPTKDAETYQSNGATVNNESVPQTNGASHNNEPVYQSNGVAHSDGSDSTPPQYTPPSSESEQESEEANDTSTATEDVLQTGDSG